MDAAISLYQTAVKLDPDYPFPYIGLGCAYLQVDPYKGLVELRNAHEKSPSSLEAMNNLGAALFLVGNRKEAVGMLERARLKDPTYPAPVMNLGVIAKAEGNEDQARKLFDAYLRLDPSSRWSESIRPKSQPTDQFAAEVQWERETIADVRRGMRLSEIPSAWGAPIFRQKLTTTVEECRPFTRHFGLFTYDSGILVVTEEDFDDPIVVIVAASPECKATSKRGVRIGSTRQELQGAYGMPLRRFRTAQGECWVYDDDSRNLSFIMNGDVVESWSAF